MISVTRLDGAEIFLNADLVESIEPTPDTLISLANGSKLVVRETPEEVVDRVIAFRRALLAGPVVRTVADGGGGRS
jgi:flagellar protein FlbD